MITLNWQLEERPQWDSTGTIAESFHNQRGHFSIRIDRFTEAEGGGYAYSVFHDGNPLRGGENEPADSFDAAEEAIVRLLGLMQFDIRLITGRGTRDEKTQPLSFYIATTARDAALQVLKEHKPPTAALIETQEVSMQLPENEIYADFNVDALLLTLDGARAYRFKD